MIEVSQLTKRYGDRVAVDGISFSVKEGEVLGFLGQNGAGKSTTMKILTGFMPATDGTAKIAGYDVFDHPIEVKKQIGYLPEAPPVYLELLVEEYLNFVAQLRQVPKSERKQKVQKALEQTGLVPVRSRLIGNLSKGYRQRVGIAQALVHEPKVLILDEPMVGLDPKQMTEIRDLIRSMRGQRTVVYSTHILSEVAATCDRILVIDQGKLVAQESLGDLSREGTIARTELVVQKVDDKLVKDLEGLSGVKKVERFTNGTNRLVVESEPGEAIMAQMSQTVVKANVGLLKMTPVQHSLEEYYLNLIGVRRRA